MKKNWMQLLVMSFLCISLLVISWLIAFHREYFQFGREERLEFLVNELTVSPQRQQNALDEIVKDGDGSFVYLLEYLGDQRLLATKEVRFLNIHPAVSEKYFLIEAKTVSEGLLRYLCWKTVSCDPWFSSEDEQAKKLQHSKINEYCKQRFVNPNTYTRDDYWGEIFW